MPELPEVEITARRLSRGAAGARIESALAPGMVTMKTFDPPLDALAGKSVDGVRRIGKMLAVEAGGLVVLVHLMSAGRLQLWDSRASLRDRASRLLIRLEGGRELRLREFGTRAASLGEAAEATRSPPTDRLRRSAPTPTRPYPPTSSPTCSTAPPPSPAAARPAGHRRDRPVLGRRAALDRAPVALSEGLRPRRRRARAAARCLRLGARGRARALRAGHRRHDPRQAPRRRCRCTGARASPARGAARRSKRSTSRTT